MIAGANHMACGGCGHGLFRAFAPYMGASHHIYLECAKCLGVSVIKPAEPSLVIEWGPAGDGILTTMVPTS